MDNTTFNENCFSKEDLKNISFPAFLINQDLSILEINCYAEELVACKREILINNDVRNIFNLHGASFPFDKEIIKSSLKKEAKFTCYFKNIKNPIEWLIFSVKEKNNGNNLYLLTNNISQPENPKTTYQLFSEAVTDHINQSIKKITEIKNLFYVLDLLIQGLPGCAHIKSNENFTYQLANNATLNLLGFKNARELIGKNDYDLAKIMQWRWPSKFAQELQDYDSSVIQEKKPIIGIEEKPYLNSNGLLVINALTKIPLYSTDNEPLGVLTFAFDTVKAKSPLDIRALYKNIYSEKNEAHKKFIEHIGLSKLISQNHSEHAFITERELDCLIACCRGKTTKEVAKQFSVSHRTIEKHIENLKNKFNCHHRQEVFDIFINAWKV